MHSVLLYIERGGSPGFKITKKHKNATPRDPPLISYICIKCGSRGGKDRVGGGGGKERSTIAASERKRESDKSESERESW